MRKAWGLTQNQLAVLLIGKSRSLISRVERAQACPCTHIVIASTILFGRSVEHLFKGLYDAVEEHVLREAYTLEEKLSGDDRPVAKRKRELLAGVIQRIVERHRQK